MRIKKICLVLVLMITMVSFIGCDSSTIKPIELMGAGDRIHDSYTFANVGTNIKDNGNNEFTIYGSVDKLTNEAAKNEFNIASDITHIVAIKLMAINESVSKNEVEVYIDGSRNYDAEHLNGMNYTFILLEAKPDSLVSISVKWNKDAETVTYKIYFDKDLKLK